MATNALEGQPKPFVAQDLAKMVIGDSIRVSYTKLDGLPGVQKVLEALESPRGEHLSRVALATYVGHEIAAMHAGVTPAYDGRIFYDPNFVCVNITSDAEVREGMIAEVRSYLSLSESEQEAYRANLIQPGPK
ncbi:MAG: hypothetical protein NUV73_02385 [Candidatus Daviesbacteria bacterium]|nr:hypothetical protein [Candidatus Daviesbacteria bacterium]